MRPAPDLATGLLAAAFAVALAGSAGAALCGLLAGRKTAGRRSAAAFQALASAALATAATLVLGDETIPALVLPGGGVLLRLAPLGALLALPLALAGLATALAGLADEPDGGQPGAPGLVLAGTLGVLGAASPVQTATAWASLALGIWLARAGARDGGQARLGLAAGLGGAVALVLAGELAASHPGLAFLLTLAAVAPVFGVFPCEGQAAGARAGDGAAAALGAVGSALAGASLLFAACARPMGTDGNPADPWHMLVPAVLALAGTATALRAAAFAFAEPDPWAAVIHAGPLRAGVFLVVLGASSVGSLRDLHGALAIALADGLLGAATLMIRPGTPRPIVAVSLAALAGLPPTAGYLIVQSVLDLPLGRRGAGLVAPLTVLALAALVLALAASFALALRLAFALAAAPPAPARRPRLAVAGALLPAVAIAGASLVGAPTLVQAPGLEPVLGRQPTGPSAGAIGLPLVVVAVGGCLLLSLRRARGTAAPAPLLPGLDGALNGPMARRLAPWVGLEEQADLLEGPSPLFARRIAFRREQLPARSLGLARPLGDLALALGQWPGTLSPAGWRVAALGTLVALWLLRWLW